VGIDIGGTFTDLVALGEDGLVTAKVPSTPADQSDGAMAALEASGLAPEAVGALAHGMTVGTNALLERRGARTALITTEGFRDVLEIGRQNRASLYDIARRRPSPLVPRELRFCVRERMGPDGALLALDAESVRTAVKAIEAGDVEAVAVCLLFSFRHPEHERAVADAVSRALPGVHLSRSSETLPEFREYERFATTAAEAYLAPLLSRYLDALAAKLDRAGYPAPVVMQSSGGVVDFRTAARRAAGCVLSGPAGGVVGAAFVAAQSGHEDVLSFDMGGTSTDVAPIIEGEVQTTTEATVAGSPIKLPMVDVHTVSAGGGSIAWADAGGALRVGPRSAGAEPGPAAYGRGGDEPTVTDADLFLGYLADGATLGGKLVLERERAARAITKLSKQLGLDALRTALGIVRVADSEMVRALRVISIERGLDPRDFALVAFGGAGAMHACALAEELAMTTVLVPQAGGVLSALGLAISDVRRDSVLALHVPLQEASAADLERRFRELERRAREGLGRPRFQRRADLRYSRQSFELPVDASDLKALAQRFAEAHERRYGYHVEDEPIELVNLRLITTVTVDKPTLRDRRVRRRARPGHRRANFDGAWHEVPVHDRRQLGVGSRVRGPAVVEFPEATCVVRPGWRGAIDETGTLVLSRRR
jgi:N-methylhydantoinase A